MNALGWTLFAIVAGNKSRSCTRETGNSQLALDRERGRHRAPFVGVELGHNV
jgi:hypothetical protein